MNVLSSEYNAKYWSINSITKIIILGYGGNCPASGHLNPATSGSWHQTLAYSWWWGGGGASSTVCLWPALEDPPPLRFTWNRTLPGVVGRSSSIVKTRSHTGNGERPSVWVLVRPCRRPVIRGGRPAGNP